jgi:methyl-accepting chemotaxis protein
MEASASVDLTNVLLKIKDNLLLKFGGRLQAMKVGDYNVLNSLENFPGDVLLRLRVIDEVREKISDPDVKSQINIIRKRVFDKARMKNLISEITAKDELMIVQDKLTEMASALVEQSSKTPTNVAQLIERARFNFDEARKFYEEESFSSSYSQALSAGAAMENALSQIITNGNDLAEELKNIKAYFDSLNNIARQSGPLDVKIVSEFKEIENRIARISDLMNDSKNLTQARKSIREIKGRMSLLGQMLDQAVARD